MVDKTEVYEVADELRSEGELVSQTSIRARLKEKTGRGGSLRDVGPYLLEWKADRTYSRPLERGGVPPAVATALGKATAALWSAARQEADQAYQGDRERFQATLKDEQALRAETLAMADGLLGQVEALDGTVAGLRSRVAALEAELAAVRQHLQAVRADHFWDRVVNEIYGILPEAGCLTLEQIAERLGADLAEEAKTHKEKWSTSTLRKKIEQRIYHKRLFARCDQGRYRRRRREDDAV